MVLDIISIIDIILRVACARYTLCWRAFHWQILVILHVTSLHKVSRMRQFKVIYSRSGIRGRDILTREQCLSCAAPTSHCQSPEFAHLMNCSCLNHELRTEARIPSLFEQLAIEKADAQVLEELSYNNYD